MHQRTEKERLRIYKRFLELRVDPKLTHLTKSKMAERMGMTRAELDYVLILMKNRRKK